MEVTGRIATVREDCDGARSGGRQIGFVPTMGFLHEGHVSLVRRARQDAGFLVVSIFVNPMQFGPAEDLDSYPRDLERDLAMLKAEGVDLVFAPTGEEMYPEGEPQVSVDPGPAGGRLEGASRPGHFRGVCTVVAKLFSIVGACSAYFGEKDAQQLWIVRRMAAELDLPVEVIGCETVREPDGLAMSSRNTYLSSEERTVAPCLYRALSAARDLVAAGERDAERVRAAMREVVAAESLAELDYATVVDEERFTEVDRVEPAGVWEVAVGSPEPPETRSVPLPHARALIAARVGTTRLIDNVPLP